MARGKRPRRFGLIDALAVGRPVIYTLFVHKQSAISLALRETARQVPLPVVRRAMQSDADQIWALVSSYAKQGLMLPRTLHQVAMNLDNYIIASMDERVVACAALEEYSPSLAEVSSVAVVESEHGTGLGTEVVLGVERLARARDISELFALSLSDRFFLSLSYSSVCVTRYPEKLAATGSSGRKGSRSSQSAAFRRSWIAHGRRLH